MYIYNIIIYIIIYMNLLIKTMSIINSGSVPESKEAINDRERVRKAQVLEGFDLHYSPLYVRMRCVYFLNIMRSVTFVLA